LHEVINACIRDLKIFDTDITPYLKTTFSISGRFLKYTLKEKGNTNFTTFRKFKKVHEHRSRYSTMLPSLTSSTMLALTLCTTLSYLLPGMSHLTGTISASALLLIFSWDIYMSFCSFTHVTVFAWYCFSPVGRPYTAFAQYRLMHMQL